ncbi:MAG: glycerophosphodiester phosphodiesterase [Lactobacillus sp.]|jgi:glycerophosphoryl diester phosphodiesterase|nr:glycerophosphodiester phosphodiesterase [Lactobacillus sp.]
MTTSTLIFGHRGFPKKFPENSLAGFEYALIHGIDGLEFDVHLTRDNIPVIIHDETINRTTDGTGLVGEMTLEQLRQYHLANGEPIPTLSGLMEMAYHYPVYLNLEFKTNKIHYIDIEEIVLTQVNRYPLQKPMIYSSFNLDSLRLAYQMDATQEYCLLAGHHIINPQAMTLAEHLKGFHLRHYQELPDDIVQRIWTIDDAKTMTSLFEKNVAGVITDNFELAQSLKGALLK